MQAAGLPNLGVAREKGVSFLSSRQRPRVGGTVSESKPWILVDQQAPTTGGFTAAQHRWPTPGFSFPGAHGSSWGPAPPAVGTTASAALASAGWQRRARGGVVGGGPVGFSLWKG